MANSATALNKIPINVKGSDITGVTPVKVVIDTGTSDLTVFTPGAGRRWAILGILYSEATAASLTIKSGSTTLVVAEFPANTNFWKGIGEGVLLCGNAAGEALVFYSSATNPSSVLVYVADFTQIRVDN